MTPLFPPAEGLPAKTKFPDGDSLLPWMMTVAPAGMVPTSDPLVRKTKVLLPPLVASNLSVEP